jgi:adenine-specific DNA-methyltransferase
VLVQDGATRKLSAEERLDPSLLPERARVYKRGDPTSQGFSRTKTVPLDLDSKVFECSPNRHWTLRVEGMQQLWKLGRLEVADNGALWLRRFWDDAGSRPLSNVWTDTSSSFARLRYVVQTVPKIIERAMLMTTDPGDLVLDPTCGSGTSAYVAERYGRRWITTDTSRVALALARERLLTAGFDYYELADRGRGVDAGFVYEDRERLTTANAGYGDDPEIETYYDRPKVDRSKMRVSGPFTVEALSRYADNPFEHQTDTVSPDAAADHVTALLEALRTMGIPRKGAPPAPVLTLEPVAGAGALHAEGRFSDSTGKERAFAVSVGPRHGPITVVQVDDALAESPGYDLIVFAGFMATAEAQQYLAPGKRGRVNVALLEANADLLLGDLLKNTKASQTFRLFAAPEAQVHPSGDGEISIELLGMDAFDAATGQVTSRDQDEIAAWFLDHDYDGSVFHVNQAFFTRSNAWDALGRALKGTIDEDVVASMHSFMSLPFQPGSSKKAAIRVVDDAGQTSEAILDLEV